MPLAKCVRCEKIFNKTDSPVCPGCLPQEEADIAKARAELERHPELSAQELAERAKVDPGVVSRMVEQGTLLNLSMADPPKCGRCGAPAISHSKRLCTACLEKLNAEVMKAQSGIRQKQPPEFIGGVHQSLEEKRRR